MRYGFAPKESKGFGPTKGYGFIPIEKNILEKEFVVNGTFDTDIGWTKSDNWIISGGMATKINASTIGSKLQSNIPFHIPVGSLVVLSFLIRDYTSGEIQVSINGTGGSETGTLTPTANTSYSFPGAGPTNIASTLVTVSRDNFIGSIDNISIKITKLP